MSDIWTTLTEHHLSPEETCGLLTKELDDMTWARAQAHMIGCVACSKLLRRFGGETAGAQEALEALIASASDPDSGVRRVAVQTLGKMAEACEEHPGAIDAIVACLRDGEWTVRWAASEALGELGQANAGGPRVLDALLACLTDDALVRPAAAQALGKLRDMTLRYPAALDALIACLRDEEWTVRSAASEALGDLGQTAARHLGVIDGLRRAYRDPAPAVRLAAESALVEMGETVDGDADGSKLRVAARALGVRLTVREAQSALQTVGVSEIDDPALVAIPEQAVTAPRLVVDRAVLWAYLCRELSPELHRQVERHLESEPRLAQQAEELRLFAVTLVATAAVARRAAQLIRTRGLRPTLSAAREFEAPVFHMVDGEPRLSESWPRLRCRMLRVALEEGGTLVARLSLPDTTLLASDGRTRPEIAFAEIDIVDAASKTLYRLRTTKSARTVVQNEPSTVLAAGVDTGFVGNALEIDSQTAQVRLFVQTPQPSTAGET